MKKKNLDSMLNDFYYCNISAGALSGLSVANLVGGGGQRKI